MKRFLLIFLIGLTQLGFAQSDSLAKKSLFPVLLNGDTLFSITEGVGPFGAQERATGITNNLAALLDTGKINSSQIRVNQAREATEIVFGPKLIMVVSPKDAEAVGVNSFALASQYAASMRATIDKIPKEKAFSKHIFSFLLAIGLTIALLVIIVVINRLFKKLHTQIVGLAGTKIKGLSYSGYQFLTPQYVARLIAWSSNIFRLLLLIIIFYGYLLLLFKALPWTENYYNTLEGWILGPLKAIGGSVLGYLPKFIFIIIVFYLTGKLVKLLGFFATEVENGKLRIPGFYKDWIRPTFNILRFIIYIFAVVLIFPYLPGSDSSAFQGISLFLGILLSLGSTSIVANAVGGIMIIYMRPFVVGDLVDIVGTTGKVVEKNLLVTRVCTSKNEVITIPNSAIINNEITNYCTGTVKEGIYLHTTVTIGYDVPWKDVHEVMLAAAAITEKIEAEPKPFVLQTALNDFNVSYELNAFCKDPFSMPTIYSNLHQNMQDKFNEAGIEIMSPHFSAVRDGNETTIPTDHRKPDYRPPFFRIFDFGRKGPNT